MHQPKFQFWRVHVALATLDDVHRQQRDTSGSTYIISVDRPQYNSLPSLGYIKIFSISLPQQRCTSYEQEVESVKVLLVAAEAEIVRVQERAAIAQRVAEDEIVRIRARAAN